MPEDSRRKLNRRFGVFELLEKVGRGGMSRVYRRDTRSGNIVAIKVATRGVINDAHLSKRFELEFAVVHPLSHPHLVKVIENGTHEQIPYLVMEYVDGPSLAQHLKTHARLNANDALAILLPIADAVTYLHQNKLIHRDIKPANILMTTKGDAKLADLGLLKNLESISQLTRSNVGLGTIQFAPPEQFDDARRADPRSDVYSLAATLYFILTGEYPFGQAPMLSVLERKLQSDFDAPITKCPDLQPGMNAAICMGLNAVPARRPGSVAEFVAMLKGEMKPPSQFDFVLPAPPPKAKAPSMAPPPERRGGARYDIELAADCRPFVGAGQSRWACWITDISANGLCLLMKRRFEPGGVLQVTFPLKGENREMNQLVRVCWTKSSEPKGWLVGGEFVNRLADEDLNLIVEDWMGKTNELKGERPA